MRKNSGEGCFVKVTRYFNHVLNYEMKSYSHVWAEILNNIFYEMDARLIGIEKHLKLY